MGSYGVGVSRLVAAVAEQHHDERGPGLAGARSPRATCTSSPPARSDQVAAALRLGERARRRAGCGVLVDDRAGVSAGVKFTDAELLGMPTAVVVGPAPGRRVSSRCATARSGERRDVPLEEIVTHLS